MTSSFVVIRALTLRAINEITRVPGAAIPGVLAPTIFMVGITGIFGAAADLRGFDADTFREFVIAVGFLQGAGFTGAATGVNLARDIEQGWFDRLVVCPAPRLALLAGIVGSAALRCLLPVGFLFVVGLALGVPWPGLDGLAVMLVVVMAWAMTTACWGVVVALRFRTQQAAPLMQVVSFAAILFTTAYAPEELLSDWLRAIANANPVTHMLEGVRQGFVGDVTWDTTSAALLAAVLLLAALGALAARGLSRYAD